jgi:acyl-CoA synthetase (AMP-forming)/AMP-acid ligase II
VNLTTTLHRGAQRTPDRPATIFNGRVTSYRDTLDRVRRLAAGLVGVGVSAGDRVAILSLNSDYFIQYFYAVPWAGGVLVPLNARWSVEEAVFALRDCDAKVLLVDAAWSSDAAALADACPSHLRIVYADDEPCPPGLTPFTELASGPAMGDVARGGSDLAGIFYTGGTTGTAKGVMLSHDNLMVSALGGLAEDFLTRGGRLLHTAPMFHLADLAGLNTEALIGGTHVIVPSFEPASVLSSISAHQVTDTILVPTMVQALVDHPSFADHDLSTLRRVVYGASPMPSQLMARAQAALPHVGFLQGYGMTELAPIAAILAPADHAHKRHRSSAGRAAPHCEIRIVDPDDVTCPPEVIGEIAVRGSNVMQGYWARPEETSVALRGGWMHTGDGGCMDTDGFVYIVDRIKDMIITGGENVYSAEVENVIASHPSVVMCAVIGVPDERWGERVHAVVVLREGRTLDPVTLRAYCKKHIAAYKVPHTLDIVDALPLSAAGKVLKRQLREQHGR